MTLQRVINEFEKRIVQAQNEIKAFDTRRQQLMNDCEAEIRAQNAIIDESTHALKALKNYDGAQG